MPSKNNVFLLIWRRCWKKFKANKTFVKQTNTPTNKQKSKQANNMQASQQANKQRKMKQKHKTKQTRTKQNHLWKHYKLCSNGFQMTTIILISIIANVTISYQCYSISIRIHLEVFTLSLDPDPFRRLVTTLTWS